eukprot:TRINITY_DN4670_c0_g1_i3.p1 TRINITY_DN4670_c0_g1~~TRINITY_DN4670_c0_g1_i3.p1  ORF type:complete len:275 (+),score=83.59 TRINITY_DN4670_c0_g1_i3:346-1170(+)
MRRAIAIARDYAHRRVVSGKSLDQQPLHLSTLSEMEIQFRGALQLLLDVLILFGKSEIENDSKIENTLRILTPLLKLFTAKQAISVTSEAIECLGGLGYMEDSDLPRLLRDAQVCSIWEGTTNVLSLDVWRSIKRNGSLELLLDRSRGKLAGISDPKLSDIVNKIKNSLESLVKSCEIYAKFPKLEEGNAREFSFDLTRTYISILFCEQAQFSGIDTDLEIARRWSKSVKDHVIERGEESLEISKKIALDFDPENRNFRGFGDVDKNGNLRSKY